MPGSVVELFGGRRVDVEQFGLGSAGAIFDSVAGAFGAGAILLSDLAAGWVRLGHRQAWPSAGQG